MVYFNYAFAENKLEIKAVFTANIQHFLSTNNKLSGPTKIKNLTT